MLASDPKSGGEGSPGINQMKKSIILPLTDEELIELQRILLDSDIGGALAFLKNHLEKKVPAAIAGEGH